jgi:hypothetical protein
MGPRQLVASARNLVIVRLRRNATGIRVTEKETETGTGTRTGIATVTVTANANANGRERKTGTETMTAIVTVTVIATETGTETETGSERESESVTATATVIAIVKRTETVVPGTTVGMTTTHDGHRVTMAAIANGIGRVTRRETVVTEIVTGMRHEEQVRDGRTENGALGETERKIQVATTSRARSERLRPMSEVRRYAFSIIMFVFSNTHSQRVKYDTEAPSPTKDRSRRAETPEEGEI